MIIDTSSTTLCSQLADKPSPLGVQINFLGEYDLIARWIVTLLKQVGRRDDEGLAERSAAHSAPLHPVGPHRHPR